MNGRHTEAGVPPRGSIVSIAIVVPLFLYSPDAAQMLGPRRIRIYLFFFLFLFPSSRLSSYQVHPQVSSACVRKTTTNFDSSNTSIISPQTSSSPYRHQPCCLSASQPTTMTPPQHFGESGGTAGQSPRTPRRLFEKRQAKAFSAAAVSESPEGLKRKRAADFDDGSIRQKKSKKRYHTDSPHTLTRATMAKEDSPLARLPRSEKALAKVKEELQNALHKIEILEKEKARATKRADHHRRAHDNLAGAKNELAEDFKKFRTRAKHNFRAIVQHSDSRDEEINELKEMLRAQDDRLTINTRDCTTNETKISDVESSCKDRAESADDKGEKMKLSIAALTERADKLDKAVEEGKVERERHADVLLALDDRAEDLANEIKEENQEKNRHGQLLIELIERAKGQVLAQTLPKEAEQSILDRLGFKTSEQDSRLAYHEDCYQSLEKQAKDHDERIEFLEAARRQSKEDLEDRLQQFEADLQWQMTAQKETIEAQEKMLADQRLLIDYCRAENDQLRLHVLKGQAQSSWSQGDRN